MNNLYEQKYKEALGWMQKLYDGLHGATKEDAEHYFPELKENEDEKIRKQILSFLKEFERDHYRNLDFSSWIAWLEKQGEQILANSAKTCKIELKFKVGDWVVFSNNHRCTYQIEKIENYQYILRHILGGSMPLNFCNEDSIRLWTIEDAEDGDVIVCDSKYGQQIGIVKRYVGKIGGCDMCFKTYCFVDWEGNFWVGAHMGSRDIHPATKEQRVLLFQKMKEAGYEWDAEKKELKWFEQSNEENYEIDGLFYAKTILEKTLGKVEGFQTDDGILEHKSAITAVEKLCEQNTTWSKEDVNMCEAVIDVLFNNTMSGSEGREVYSEEIEWLKSLKEKIEKRNED